MDSFIWKEEQTEHGPWAEAQLLLNLSRQSVEPQQRPSETSRDVQDMDECTPEHSEAQSCSMTEHWRQRRVEFEDDSSTVHPDHASPQETSYDWPNEGSGWEDDSWLDRPQDDVMDTLVNDLQSKLNYPIRADDGNPEWEDVVQTAKDPGPTTLTDEELKLLGFDPLRDDDTNQINLPFGMPTHGIKAAYPAVDRFIYPVITPRTPDDEHDPNPLPRISEPAPAVDPPPGVCYPISEPWFLVDDNRFARGQAYIQDRSSGYDSITKEKEHCLHIIMPPNVNAEYDSSTDRWVHRDIPGMVRMRPGVPYVWRVDGDSRKMVFIGACETLESLRTHPYFTKIVTKCERLFVLILGRAPTLDDPVGIKPLFTYDFLKPNQRSKPDDSKKKPKKRKKRTTKKKKKKTGAPSAEEPSPEEFTVTLNFDGSFSIAGTVEQGNGPGTFAPASQAAYPEVREQISEILQIINYLYRQIVPWCLSKQESDINDFHSWINNVFSIGGMEPCATSVQMNVSSSMSGGDMLKMLGEVQGSWHVDIGDDITRITFFILLFRLPKGADPGPFLLGRPGLYCRELDVWIIFIIFSGRDLHSGVAPRSLVNGSTFTQDDLEGICNAWDQADKAVRVGLVPYSTGVATNRSGNYSVTPATRFGNFGTQSSSQARSLNFAQDGKFILGNTLDASSRLGHEMAFNFLNGLAACGLQLDMPSGLNGLLSSIRYQDGSDWSPIKPSKWDPFDPQDKVLIEEMKQFYVGKLRVHTSLLLHITKHTYINRKSKMQIARLGLAPAATQVSDFRPLTVPRPAQQSVDLTQSPPFLVVRVLERLMIGSKVKWNVVLSDDSKCTLDSETDDMWIRHPTNKPAFDHYLITTVATELPELDLPPIAKLPAPPSLEIPALSLNNFIAPSPTLGSSASSQVAPTFSTADTWSGSPLTNLSSLPPSPRGSPKNPSAVAMDVDLPSDMPALVDLHLVSPAPIGNREVFSDPAIMELNTAVFNNSNDGKDQVVLPAQAPLSEDVSPLLSLGDDGESEVPDNDDVVNANATLSKRRCEATEENPSKRQKTEGVQSDEDPDKEWEVDAIIGHSFNGKEDVFRVLWRGFKASDATWEREQDIPNLRDSIQEFFLRSGKAGSRLIHVSNRTRTTDAIGNPTCIYNLDRLSLVLDADYLRQTLQNLIAVGHSVQGQPTEHYKRPGKGITSVLQDIQKVMKHQNMLSSYLDYNPLHFIPTSSRKSSPTSQAASMRMTLSRLQGSIGLLKSIQIEGFKIDILAGILRWQHCRCLLVIYQFITHDLPTLTDVLLDAAERTSSSDQVDIKNAKEVSRRDLVSVDSKCSFLCATYPEYAPLLIRIIEYVYDHRRARTQSYSKSSARKNPSRASLKDAQDSPVSSPNTLARVPSDLFGLVETGTEEEDNDDDDEGVLLPDLPNRIGNGWQGIRKAVKDCFIDLVEREIVFSAVREADIYFNGPRNKESWDSARARSICRGAVLQQLVDVACDESIFYSPAVDNLVKSPTLLWSHTAIEANRVDQHIVSTPSVTLGPIRAWIEEHFTEECREAAEDLGAFFHRHALSFLSGRSVSYKEFMEEQAKHRGEMSEKNVRGKAHVQQVGYRGNGPKVTISRESILENGEMPHFGGLGLVYREAANDRLGMPAGNSMLRQFLRGEKVGEGRKRSSGGVDQVSPVRADNIGMRLFKQKLPKEKLLGPEGLSNASLWIMTGQGPDTQEFLRRTDPEDDQSPDTYYATTLSHALQVFGSALLHNQDVLSRCTSVETNLVDPDSESPPLMLRQQGMVQISSCTIYGTASNLLKLLPTKSPKDRVLNPIVHASPFSNPSKFSLYEKVSPCFSPELIEAYKDYLVQPNQAWMDMVRLIERQNLGGLRTGLAKFQLALDMAYSGICKMPTIEELAVWIWDHPQLGAFKGLLRCGFRLQNLDGVRIALTIVQDHIDFFMSSEDKNCLHTSPGSTEHGMCKVVRWINRIARMEYWITIAERDFVWSRPEGRRGFEDFPFPLRGDKSRIDAIIAEFQDSVNTPKRIRHLAQHDIDRLDGLNDLNDEIINFFVDRLQGEPNTLVFSTFLFPKLCEVYASGGDEKWARVWRFGPLKLEARTLLQNRKRILIPMLVDGNHWIVGAINLEVRSIEIYDSLTRSTSGRAAEVEILKVWISKLAILCEQKLAVWNEWTINPQVKMPQQGNTHDCGVFTTLVLIHLQSGLELNHRHVDASLRIPWDDSGMSLQRRALRQMVTEESS